MSIPEELSLSLSCSSLASWTSEAGEQDVDAPCVKGHGQASQSHSQSQYKTDEYYDHGMGPSHKADQSPTLSLETDHSQATIEQLKAQLEALQQQQLVESLHQIQQAQYKQKEKHRLQQEQEQKHYEQEYYHIQQQKEQKQQQHQQFVTVNIPGIGERRIDVALLAALGTKEPVTTPPSQSTPPSSYSAAARGECDIPQQDYCHPFSHSSSPSPSPSPCPSRPPGLYGNGSSNGNGNSNGTALLSPPRAQLAREDRGDTGTGAGAGLSDMPSDGYIYQVQFKCSYRWLAKASEHPHPHPHAPALKTEDFVKVEADRGEGLGLVVRKVLMKDFREEKATAGFRGRGQAGAADNNRRIVRIATEEERAQLVIKSMEEERVLQVCREKVEVRKLPMVIVDAEFQFDRHKLTFFFEADRRIDFRELVSDLFALYKTRIWMQQIDDSFRPDRYMSMALLTGGTASNPLPACNARPSLSHLHSPLPAFRGLSLADSTSSSTSGSTNTSTSGSTGSYRSNTYSPELPLQNSRMDYAQGRGQSEGEPSPNLSWLASLIAEADNSPPTSTQLRPHSHSHTYY
jgi:hypothetical protein